MARNYNAQSMFPYTSGDHSQQTNQHHGNFMNGSSNDYNNLNYSDTNNSDHNSQKHFNDRMFNYNSNNNYNQNNSFFSNSNSSNDQFWSKRGQQHNYNNKDDQNSGFFNRNEQQQSVNKLSSNLNQMSIADKSINKLTNKNAKQQSTTTTASSKTMSWASIASQPAKAQPKSFKSKLATVVLSSTSTTKHVPPPMPPVAQISLDEIEPIPNPWANKNNNQKSSKDDQLNNDLDNPPLNRQNQDNYRKVDSGLNNNRDYNAQHDQPNHKSYGNRSQDNERFNDQHRSQYNRFDQQQNNNNNRFNNNQNSGRNNSLNNSHNSYSSRNENMRDNNYHQQRDNFNQQTQNYHNNNNNYNSRGNNYNNSNYYNNQNNNYHNNKHSNQRSQYQQSQQNNQFQNKNQNQRFNTGQHMQQKNQLPPSQYANKQSQQQMQPLPQLTEQQRIRQEEEAKELLDKLYAENNYNPDRFELNTKNAKYFIIKSYSEDDIHRSIKYSIWCSTEHGNIKLDNAFREQRNAGPIYLFYSVNGSGHFCGIAEMISPVDYNASSGIWAQDKWKGQFKVKWIYIKDVPNNELRHIVLENNDFKPVTNSRDTQEVPPEKGKAVLNVIHSHKHKTSIFDDFFHYERKQYEELLASKSFDSPASGSSITQQIGSNQYNKNNQFNKQQQNDNKRDTSPDSSHNLNNSNNSKGSILSSNYETSNVKKSWAEQCD